MLVPFLLAAVCFLLLCWIAWGAALWWLRRRWRSVPGRAGLMRERASSLRGEVAAWEALRGEARSRGDDRLAAEFDEAVRSLRLAAWALENAARLLEEGGESW